MHVAGLWLTDFRCYEHVVLEFPAGVSVISGANAQGKTSLLEAIGWAATGKSFRRVPDHALVRRGADSAVVRTEVVDDARRQLFEAEICLGGRNRLQVNKHPVQRARDLVELMRVTVFAPDDLQLVKGGPTERREYLDDLLVAVSPRYKAARADYDRVLRQRNTLLKGGMRDSSALPTLDVFDAQLAAAGGELVRGRVRLIERLLPAVKGAYAQLAGTSAPVTAVYESGWRTLRDETGVHSDHDFASELLDALSAGRRAEIDRGTTLAGPHRDEWRLRIDDLESRTHASQGEQRTLALALRLAGHRVCTELTGTAPVLLLDDVFSELDEQRAVALVRHLDAPQTLVTCVSRALPPGIDAQYTLRVDAGRVEEAA